MRPSRLRDHAGLVVDTLHMHLGWGLRDRDEAAFREGLAILAAAAKRIDHSNA